MSENGNNQYRLLSPWAYVGYGILFTLPVIGWILAIVFALNDDNLNRRNFARAAISITTDIDEGLTRSEAACRVRAVFFAARMAQAAESSCKVPQQ